MVLKMLATLFTLMRIAVTKTDVIHLPILMKRSRDIRNTWQHVASVCILFSLTIEKGAGKFKLSNSYDFSTCNNARERRSISVL